MTPMTITKGLKEKNKIVKIILDLKSKIQSHNSYREGNKPAYETPQLMTLLSNRIHDLSDLKTKIHNASAPVRYQIFRLSELKSHINFLRSISTAEGKQPGDYSAEVYVAVAQINTVDIDKEIEKYEAEIELIQDELEKFNSSTNI